MTNTPEGWYADPDRPGSTRWWDGAAWGPTAPPPQATAQTGVTGSLGAASLAVGVVAVLSSVVLDGPITLLLAGIGLVLAVLGAVAARRTSGLASGAWIAGIALNGSALLWVLLRFVA
ncbi:DUF2510 domain-containing protein [Agromyces sp. Soil535]|uniref:DUF2510 domain-containing protein n=1 Tax=Agromyces sp. Soil535 TaxID=1736390 RepID=UPI00138ED569|nr:DUF2510 domain-containing protein [Agromyces sp. Soil535]